MRVSIVIPVYCEERTIDAVLERVCALRLPNAETEIIVVNDGSADRTRERLESYPFPAGQRVRVYHAPINYGKGASLRMGMALATGDVIACQDADLELDPAELPKLIEPVLRGKCEIMYGSRFLSGANDHVPRKTRLANWFLTALTNVLFGGRLTDMETAYKVFRRDVADRLRLRCVEFDIEPEITGKALRLGYEIRELPIRYQPRTVAEGKTIGLADGLQAIWTLLRVRLLPLAACERTARQVVDVSVAGAV